MRDMAYTLQVGREAQEHRLGLTARTMEEVKEKLRGFLSGQAGVEGMEGVYVGEVKKKKEWLGGLSGDEEIAGAVSGWMRKGKYGRVLEMWVKGMEVEWEELYGEGEEEKPRRIGLPSYPFARTRYWVSVPGLEEKLEEKKRGERRRGGSVERAGSGGKR